MSVFIDNFIKNIDKIQSSEHFLRTALELFHYQYKKCEIYQQYVNVLGVKPKEVKDLEKIPFLPISFFKTHKVISFNEPSEEVFLSSATTGVIQSKHHVKSLQVYEQSFLKGFEYEYGKVGNYTIIGLLPSYLDRKGSSLIYMVQKMIAISNSEESAFHKQINEDLLEKLRRLKDQGRKVLLIGVSYALMDLADTIDFSLQNIIVMETGGMKGKRKELLKEELHQYLKTGLGVKHIHSEYGMTELLSQAYAKKNGVFSCPPWMKAFTREVSDPFSYVKGKTGALNIIDLANEYSCSFIATDDLGRLNPDGSFSVLGRMSGADTRGCNLLYE